MNQICTLKDLDNSNKLGDAPANYYLPSQTELEEQLSCAKKDREDDLDKSKKDNEKLSNCVHQLKEETMRLQSEIDNSKLGDKIRYLHSEINDLKLQITRKDISFADAESKFSIKSEEMQALQSTIEEEIQALQSRVKELEQDLSLAQNELSEIESLKNESELENTNLFLAKLDLEKT
ncbi:29565_t:CDS:2, partial [Gigaspora margarita]